MVKRTIPQARKTIKQLESQICARKSLRANLHLFVGKLNRKHQQITTKEYLVRVHNFITNFKTVAKKLGDLNKPAYDFVRICKHCGNWKNISKTVECIQCEDYYHISCVDQCVDDLGHWFCLTCTTLCEMIEDDQTKLDRHFTMAPKSLKICKKCQDAVTKQLASCMKCGNHYHADCFDAGAKGLIVCVDCHRDIQERIMSKNSLKQTRLDDYYQLKEDSKSSLKSWDGASESTVAEELTISYSYPLNLKAPAPLTPKQIQYYKKGLLYAVYSKKMEYSENLVYEASHPLDIQCQDPTLDFISKKDQKAYLLYKKQPIGPYLFVLIQNKGYDVRVDANIPKGTIICEYIGEVITKRQALDHIDNDSLMDLMLGMDADSSLIIKPQKFTNMARFINGANNTNTASMKKINVKTVKFNIGGRPAIILYATRKIPKGQSLQYDYNAGGLDKFPTETFVV